MATKKIIVKDEASWQEPVINIITDATRAGLSPSKGDRYLLSDGANINKICYYDSASWIYLVPLEGWLIWNDNNNLFYKFDGSNWSILVHTQGTDQGLDTGGANAVTASQIKNTFNNIIYNLLLAFFKLSVQAGLVVYNLIDGIMDEFEDESGLATKTNATYDSVNDLYSPTKTAVTLLDYMEYATDGAAQAAYVTNGTATSTITQQQTSSDDEAGLNTAIPRTAGGQGFKVSTVDNISKFTFRLANFSNADGTLTGYIYSDDGNNYPNAVLATFSSLAVNTISTYDTFTNYEFTGSFTPTIGTQYHIVILVAGQTQGVIMFRRYTGGGYSDGRLEVKDNGVWGVGNYSGNDTYFKIYQDIPNLQCYSESTIKTQGSYSLKGIVSISSEDIYAQQTDSTGGINFGDDGDDEIRPRQRITLDTTQTISKVLITFGATAGSPSGQITCRIETDNGSERPTGTLAHANATNTFTPTASTENTIEFTDFSLVAGIYWIVLNCDNQATDVHWIVRYNISGGYSGGWSARWYPLSSTWDDSSQARDLQFKVYTLCGSPVNKTLTRTIGSSIDLTGINTIKFDIRASRTGSNIKVGVLKSPAVDQSCETYNTSDQLFGTGGGGEKCAQSFQVSAGGIACSKVELFLYKSATPTDNVVIRIETNNSGSPSGTLVDANATVAVAGSGLSTTPGNWYTFTFPTSITLATSTLYWLVVSRSGSRDETNYYNTQVKSAGYANGLYTRMDSGSWVSVGSGGYDAAFRVYKSYANIETTPVIASADTFQTVTWDISGVSDANKDAIDKIIITIINADAANTFYVDNMYAGISETLNMILISTTTTAVTTPTKSRIVLFEEDVDSITLNTDLKAYMSRNGGTTYTQHTLVNEGNYDTSKRILASESIDISGQPSGTSMKWKVESLNNKDLKLHGVGNNWGD